VPKDVVILYQLFDLIIGTSSLFLKFPCFSHVHRVDLRVACTEVPGKRRAIGKSPYDASLALSAKVIVVLRLAPVPAKDVGKGGRWRPGNSQQLGFLRSTNWSASNIIGAAPVKAQL
jgi:hypothetical protein